MGHTSTSTLFKHYRERVTPDEAEAFWGIFPEGEAENIISLAEYTQPVRMRLAMPSTHKIKAAR